MADFLRFELHTDNQVTAEGCQFTDGTVIIRDLTDPPATAIYATLAAAQRERSRDGSVFEVESRPHKEGDRIVDGGEHGTLVTCPECQGAALLFLPDETQPTQPQRRERHPQRYPSPVPDLPYPDRNRWAGNGSHAYAAD
jgi:hypothetical protein